MTVTPHPAEIKKIVARTFREYGADEPNLADLSDTILLEQGRYVARTYRAGGMMAMWLISAGVLQFYDREGAMLRTVNLLKELAPRRAAA